MKVALLSGAAGIIAAILGWAVAVALFANYPDLDVFDVEIGWGGMLAICTGVLIVFVTTIMKRQLDPLMTAMSGLVGAGLLFNVREAPLDGMDTGTTQYWVIVVGLIGLFVNMALSLRGHRGDGR